MCQHVFANESQIWVGDSYTSGAVVKIPSLGFLGIGIEIKSLTPGVWALKTGLSRYVG